MMQFLRLLIIVALAITIVQSGCLSASISGKIFEQPLPVNATIAGGSATTTIAIAADSSVSVAAVAVTDVESSLKGTTNARDESEPPAWFSKFEKKNAAAMSLIAAALTNSLTDIGAALFTSAKAEHVEQCARNSTVWLLCAEAVNGEFARCSGAMLQRGTRSLVLTSGHCLCPDNAWRATSMWLAAARNAESSQERACTTVKNFFDRSSGREALDGMVLDCGPHDGLVQPLLVASRKPRTEERLVITGYTQGDGEHVLHLAQRNETVYLHAVPAKKASSYGNPGTLLLANGDAHELSRHDAFTQAGAAPNQGLSGGPVLNSNCELVGVVRGTGSRNNQGVYVPAAVLLQRLDTL